ncbi:site-specific DNA-methyltransferase [Alphaproteobacteria bacterium]|nr:site-specific DNA-methyltransferase [Alphaproteobacteria bacterium]
MFKKNDHIYVKSGKIFNQHFYWTKQPVNVIHHFIKRYTIKSETVLDPFCGSGSTGLAAQMLNRKSILSDISSTSIHISKGYNSNINFSINELDNFLYTVKTKLQPYYETSLKGKLEKYEILYDIIGEVYKNKNGKKYTEAKQIFESITKNKTFKSKITREYQFSNYQCIYRCLKINGKKKYLSLLDLKNNEIPQINKANIPLDYFFGKESKRNLKFGINQVFQLYSHRNLFALSLIKKEIKKIKNCDLKNFLNFCFSSILFNCSLMSRFRKYENTSIKMGTYYIPKLIKDNNVLLSFTRKAKSIYNAKSNFFRNYSYFPPEIIKQDASKLNNIKTSSIDLIYADPPYGEMINYSELNLVIESWLDLNKKYINEMIIDESVGKTEQYFFNLFKNFLTQASRVLKKNKYLILVFHNPNLKIWKSLQEELLLSKFEIKKTYKPIRILSKNKTASQRKTKKRTQGFLVFTLINKKKYFHKKIKKLSKQELIKLRLNSEKYGYKTERDKFDFFINYIIGRYEIDDQIIDFLKQSDLC